MARDTTYDRVEEIGGFQYIKLETGRRVSFWDALGEADEGKRKVWRWLSRVNKLAASDSDLEQYEWFVDDLEMMVTLHREALEKKMGKKSKEERIALLRHTTGRTPEEAEAFHAKADKLERELEDNQ